MHRRSGAWAVRTTLGSLLVASLLLSVAPAQGQAAVGALYVTPTVVADEGDPTGGCASVPVYELNGTLPAEEGQAPTALGAGLLSCPTLMTYTAPAATTLTGTAAFRAVLYCDTPNFLVEVDVSVLLNGDEVGAGSYLSSAADPCSPLGGLDLNVTVDVDGTAVAAGDVLSLDINVYWLAVDPSAQGTAGFVTGGATPSALYAAGLTGGPSGPIDPDDVDGDGLNDTCETQYFGNLTAANATGDADGDGLSNAEECAAGTDPTDADSDDDGTNDKDDPFPTDPTQGGNRTTTTTTSSSTSTSRSSTSRSSSSSSAKESVTDLAGAIDRLQSDAGYVGMSAGGFLAVLVLCVIALAVRWSL